MLAAVAGAVRTVNCYYSNLIEGHDTRLAEIDRAIRKDYSGDPARRNLQKEALAHIEVQTLIERRLDREPELNVYGTEFLTWVHREFYERLPEEFRWIADPATGRREPVRPGALRHHDVRVGAHVPPAPAELERALGRFAEAYDPRGRSGIENVALAGAAHHRLLWIHPFGDGNGRVTRLMSDALMRRAGMKGHGLWTVSRGLAQARGRYKELLAGADAEKWNDYDGRGALSLKGLGEFADFFLEVCLDQVTFMHEVLKVDALGERLEKYVSGRANGFLPPPPGGVERLRPELAPFMRDLALLGTIPRAEAPRRMGVEVWTARRILAGATAEGLIVSESTRAPLRLALPSPVATVVLPGVYGN